MATIAARIFARLAAALAVRGAFLLAAGRGAAALSARHVIAAALALSAAVLATRRGTAALALTTRHRGRGSGGIVCGRSGHNRHIHRLHGVLEETAHHVIPASIAAHIIATRIAASVHLYIQGCENKRGARRVQK